ncbi:MAG: exodeoxyribonuclease V subunit alpha [Solirubrobacteraceae bacterium]
MSALGLGREDPFEPRRAAGATGTLAQFNAVGILSAADVHVAQRLAGLVGEDSEPLMLAAALAVRAPRLGHVFVDLATIRDTASVEAEEPVDLSALAWPDVEGWLDELGSSPLTAVGEAAGELACPLRLLGSRLYLDRYWREERRVAEDLHGLSMGAAPEVDVEWLRKGLLRLFGRGSDPLQRAAAAAAVLRRLAVVGGGPGTGKTTTVARIVTLLAEQSTARGARLPLVALAAPTGKAAARLQEAVHHEAVQLETAAEVRQLVLDLRATTLHRLLGLRPGSHNRFRHDRENRLPHDVVVVDETSMISLFLMARLVEAVRAEARLILVGDPGQLASIEAGAVLGDVVGPASDSLRMSGPARAALRSAVGEELPVEAVPPSPSAIGNGIVVLHRVYRYGAGIARLAAAIRAGDSDRAVAVLQDGHEEVTWLAVAAGSPEAAAELGQIRGRTVAAARRVLDAARAGEAREALAAVGAFRLLCATRRGPFGVSTWTSRQQAWLAEELDDLDLERRDFVGRPLLVTENDYELGLYNGDTGVIVQRPDTGRTVAVFERAGELLSFSPLRLGAVETVYAMTIHKSQGSQFTTAAVLLPDPTSPVLTRELLYTAVTRARERLILAGTEATIRAAVARPVARASGLRERLWGPES